MNIDRYQPADTPPNKEMSMHGRRAMHRSELTCAALAIALLSSAPPASALSQDDLEMPFPCGQVWNGATRVDHPTGSGSSFALDLNRADDRGAPVVASADGVVRIPTGAGDRAVNTVQVVHADGWTTSYLHMSRSLLVSNGQHVVQGQQLGTVSDVGSSGAAHLHYEQRHDGVLQHIRFHGTPVTYSLKYNGPAFTSQNCPGTGPGTPPLPEPVGRFSTVIGRGDFSGDGLTDILAVQRDGTFFQYRGDGAGGWVTGDGDIVGTGWSAFKDVLAPGDFDGDGNADVIVVQHDGGLALYRGNGAGGWITGAGEPIGSGWGGFTDVLTPGDFDGDGNADLMALDPTGALYLYRGNGAGGWITGAGELIGSGWGVFRSIVTPGDFDGDGNADLIVVQHDGGLALYRGNGAGGWITGAGEPIGSGWEGFRIVFSPGDFDGDGNADVIGIQPDGAMTLYRGNGSAPGPWITGAGEPIGSGF
jgi:hypothetical protein